MVKKGEMTQRQRVLMTNAFISFLQFLLVLIRIRISSNVTTVIVYTTYGDVMVPVTVRMVRTSIVRQALFDT